VPQNRDLCAHPVRQRPQCSFIRLPQRCRCQNSVRRSSSLKTALNYPDSQRPLRADKLVFQQDFPPAHGLKASEIQNAAAEPSHGRTDRQSPSPDSPHRGCHPLDGNSPCGDQDSGPERPKKCDHDFAVQRRRLPTATSLQTS